jgi:hypothetical protein
MVCIESFSITTFWGALKLYSIVANLVTWGHILKTQISMCIKQWLREDYNKRQREARLKGDQALCGLVNRVDQRIASFDGIPKLPSDDADMIKTILTFQELLKDFRKDVADVKNTSSPTRGEPPPLVDITGNASTCAPSSAKSIAEPIKFGGLSSQNNACSFFNFVCELSPKTSDATPNRDTSDTAKEIPSNDRKPRSRDSFSADGFAMQDSFFGNPS